MINRDNFIKEIAEVINRNSMESAFNDTPDYILARVAVEAMEMFTRASAHRDDYHEFRTADYEKKRNAILNRTNEKPAASCKGCPFTEICPDVQIKRQPEPERKKEYKKPEAFDVPKEVTDVLEFARTFFPGAKIELHRIDVPRNNPRNKRRNRNKRNNGKGGNK